MYTSGQSNKATSPLHMDLSSYSCGANVHSRLTHGLLNPHKSAPKQHPDRFMHFCRAPQSAQHTQTHRSLEELATSVAGRCNACNAA